MPGHYDKGDYDSRSGGGGGRYRGQGRGGRGSYSSWGGGRGSSGGGGRGYGRGGGGSYSPASSYRDSGSSYGHDRYGESRRSSGHVVNPWDVGMGPREGGHSGEYGAHASGMGGGGMSGHGGGSSHLMGSLNHLSHMDNDKSKLALDIINAVLSNDSTMGERRGGGWDQGPPPRKQRRVDWEGMRPHKYPPREQHYRPRRAWERRGWSSPAQPRSDQYGAGDHQGRRMAKARRGKPWHDARSSKGGGRDPQAKEGDSSPTPQSEAAKETKAEARKEEEEAEGKEVEGKEKSEDQGKGEEQEPDEITYLPKEALKCHMCSLSKFPDIKAYMRHMESRRHESLRYSFHAKGAAILRFLRSDSKLSAQRRILKNQRRGLKGPIMRCRKCQCEVFGYIREHAKTVEHIALRNYLRVECCDNTFFNRADLEEHRLSLQHLKMDWEKEQKQKETEVEEKEKVEDTGVRLNDEAKLIAKTLTDLRCKSLQPDVASPETLTPFDPCLPQGLNYIAKKSFYRCEVCPGERLVSAQQAEQHFRSLIHYNNIGAHLSRLQLQKEREEERKRLEEEARKAKELEEEKKQQEEEEKKRKREDDDDDKRNGEGDDGEEISVEDLNNMETVDETCDDDGARGEEEEEGGEQENSEDGEEQEKASDISNDKLEDMSCLADVGEELDKEEVMEEDKKAKAEQEEEQDQDMKDSTQEVEKAESEEEEEEKQEDDNKDNKDSKIEEEEVKGRGARGAATPRARRARGRGRGRAKAAKN